MKIIIYGLGSFAKLLCRYISADSNYDVIAFCADSDFIECNEFCGLPLVSFDTIEKEYPSSQYKMLVAVGYSKMRNRKVMFDKAKSKGYQLINYIHPSVIYHDLKKGENNIILPGCVIEPNVKIGDNNVIWSMSLLGHDCIIGSHNYISAKCLISGNSKLKDLSFIGNGTIMINGITIDNETCVGAATYLRKSTISNGLYSGNPAKLLKINENGICLS